MHRGKVLAEYKGLEIIDCQECGYAHVNPIPTIDDLTPYYETEFYTDTKARAYLDTTSDQEKKWRDGLYSDRLVVAEQYLQTDKSNNTLLDIGCGPGRFLEVARKRGWVTKGIEPGLSAVDHCADLGLDVNHGFFNGEAVKKLNQYDIVHSDMVLEHVPNPFEFVNLIKRVLSPYGILIISVPNDFNPFQLTLEKSGNYSPWWIDRDHVNYFNFDTLANLLEKCGFSVCDRLTTFPMDMFLMMGEDYTKNSELGPACHKKRMLFDLRFDQNGTQESRISFYRQLAHAGIGRHVILIASINQN